MLLNWVYVCPKGWCFLQLLGLKHDLSLGWLGGRSARWSRSAFPALNSVALWKLCVRGLFCTKPDWELEIHMVTDNSQLSVKLVHRKCYMTDVSTTALFQTDGGKKKPLVSNQISLDGLRKRNLTHAPHFEKLLNITSQLKTNYTMVLKICKYTAMKLSLPYRMRTTIRGWKNDIFLMQETHVRVATPCLSSEISSFFESSLFDS